MLLQLHRSGLSWRPLEAVGLESRVHSAFARVDAFLRQPPRHDHASSLARDTGLSGEHVGPALFYFYSHLSGVAPEDVSEQIERALNAAADAASAAAMRFSLYEGILGYAWMLEHLSPIVGVEDSAFSEALDDAALAALGEEDLADDLITGTVGVGTYALERRTNATDVEAILARVVARLETHSQPVGGGVAWPAHGSSLPADARDHREIVYILGLAHGVPGIVAFLARLHGEGLGGDPVTKLVEGALGWMRSQMRSAPSPAWFDHLAGPGSAIYAGRSRLAWCYGDLSVAIAFALAATHFEQAAWMETARQIACTAALRSHDRSGVLDAGLCHGAAGVAHLFHTLWILTADDSIRDAAVRWYDDALTRLETDANALRSFWPGENATWRDDRSFLTGASGIGLALMAAISPVPPRWSRLLLTSYD
ncbi:MAG TPA: lanthionine synthetase C family protein [Thermoanaerobaculia bacterium]